MNLFGTRRTGAPLKAVAATAAALAAPLAEAQLPARPSVLETVATHVSAFQPSRGIQVRVTEPNTYNGPVTGQQNAQFTIPSANGIATGQRSAGNHLLTPADTAAPTFTTSVGKLTLFTTTALEAD